MLAINIDDAATPYGGYSSYTFENIVLTVLASGFSNQ